MPYNRDRSAMKRLPTPLTVRPNPGHLRGSTTTGLLTPPALSLAGHHGWWPAIGALTPSLLTTHSCRLVELRPASEPSPATASPLQLPAPDPQYAGGPTHGTLQVTLANHRHPSRQTRRAHEPIGGLLRISAEDQELLPVPDETVNDDLPAVVDVRPDFTPSRVGLSNEAHLLAGLDGRSHG